MTPESESTLAQLLGACMAYGPESDCYREGKPYCAQCRINAEVHKLGLTRPNVPEALHHLRHLQRVAGPELKPIVDAALKALAWRAA